MSENNEERPVFFIPDTAKEVGEYRRKVLNEMPTLRDNFAMSAISGLLDHFADQPHVAAKHAYEIADAMLLERERTSLSDPGRK